jgi:hypothetical protein
MNIVAPESRLPESHVVTMAKDYAEQTGAIFRASPIYVNVLPFNVPHSSFNVIKSANI